MPFNFDLNNTNVFQAVKRERFPVFKFADFLKGVFLVLFSLSLFFVVFSFSQSSVKMAFVLFSFFLIFWNLSLFVKFKIKKTKSAINILEALSNPEKYNLAEFLNFESAKIIEDALKFCKKKKRYLSSAVFLYSAVKLSKEFALIFYRLGIDIKKIEDDLRNYLEKSVRGQSPDNLGTDPNFAEDFKNTINEALKISVERGREAIGEKEILAGLAGCDEFFRKVLIDYDLKKEDIENITLWLSSAENSIEKNKKFWSRENLMRYGSMGKDWASGYTITLDQFSIDWRRSVSKWTFREIIGHQKEIEQAEIALARSNLSNVLIIGETGTGRKSIIEALAQRCYLGESLPELNNKRVVELDLVSLSARIQDFEKIETTLDQIFQETLASGNVILAIDELQNFVGGAVQKPGAVDVSGILSKYLAMPSFQFIGITNYEGLHKNIEQVPSFADFFRKIEVSEISESETIRILQGSALELEQKNKILILYPAIREIVNLTGRYMPSLPFPKKALDILDEAVVYLQTQKEKVLKPSHIAKVISDRTEIPIGKMEVKEKETLLNLENLIHQRIVNQEEAVKEISIAMRRARAGIASKKRPMGNFLFLGPTGVGKTETAKALAQIYFGRPSSAKASDGQGEKMIRLDMSEFQAISDIPRLIGAVSPVEMQGLLTTPVRETPFSLLLLDEIEKAHPNILNLFLQVFDEGHITDGQGRKVVFTNTIIICTSNAAAEMIFKEVSAQGGPASGGEVKQLLGKDKLLESLFKKEIFKPEFINRFDAVVLYHPLTKENLLDIADLMLKGLQKNLKEKEIDFEITNELKQKVVELSYKPAFGAREMRRVVQDKVENSVAQALISETIKKGDKIEINPETFELIVNQ